MNAYLTKKMFRVLCILWMLCTVSVSVFLPQTVFAKSSKYSKIFKKQDYKIATVKKGKYTFRYFSGKVFIVKADGTNQSTPLDYGAYTNGKTAIYISDGKLMKYTLSDGKSKKLKTLPKGKSRSEYDGYDIKMIYGNNFYVTRTSFDDWEYVTYAYNMSKKTIKKQIKGKIIAIKGKYVLAQMAYKSDVSPYKLNLYKITSKGIKKVKTLSSLSYLGTFVGNKLYYTDYTNNLMEQCDLHVADKDGSNDKVLVTFPLEGKITEGQLMILDITSKKCTIWMNNEWYEYTFQTGTMKKLK